MNSNFFILVQNSLLYILLIPIICTTSINAQEIAISNKTGYPIELKVYLKQSKCPANFELRLDNDQIIKLYKPLLNSINKITYYTSGQLKKYTGKEYDLFDESRDLPTTGNILRITLPISGYTQFNQPIYEKISLNTDKDLKSTIDLFLENITKSSSIDSKYEDEIRKLFHITSRKSIYSLMPAISDLAFIINQDKISKHNFLYLYYTALLYKKLSTTNSTKDLYQFKNCLKKLSTDLNYQSNIDKLIKIFSSVTIEQLKNILDHDDKFLLL